MEKMLKPIKITSAPLFLSFSTKNFIKPNILTILNQNQEIFNILKESDTSFHDITVT